jgi:hypothetical protein
MYVETCWKKWTNIHNKWKIKLTSLDLATSQKSVIGFDKSMHTWKGKMLSQPYESWKCLQIW